MPGLISEFKKPSNDYSPFPLWFLNGDLKEEKIEKQLRDFAAKGVYGILLHPRIGIPKTLQYLSDEFMQKMAFAARIAKEIGMKVLLYDEAAYPSGSAHGLVVKENPDFAAKGVRMMPDLSEMREGERVLYKIAVRMTGEREYDFDSARVIEDADGVRDGETAFYIVAGFSMGTIRGIHEDEEDMHPAAPKAGDLMNYEAMQTFIRLTHERYYEYLKEDFGTTVIGIFTDEPMPTGRCGIRGMRPWTDGFNEEIAEKGFKPEYYPALWLNAGGKEKKIRADYERLVNYKLIETYYHPISEWCVKHNISLCGHPHTGQDSIMLTEFQIPGQDVVWRWVAPENDLAIGGAESAQAKCASDIARHIGAKRNMNECFGCCGPNGEMWALNVDDVKWYLSWLFVRGCNFIAPHAFYYELLTRVQADRPPDAGPNNIWWSEYGKISAFIKRMSMINTGGVNTARIAVLGSCDTLPVDAVRYLYENQVEFNYLLDSHLVDKCIIENGKILIEKQAYDALLVDGTVSYLPKAYERIEEIRKKGVSVYDKADGKLLKYAAVKLTGKKKNIRASEVVRDGSDIVILVNEGEKPYKGKITLPFDGVCARLDPWNGKTESICAENSTYELELGRREVLVLAKTKGAEKLPRYEKETRKSRTVSLDDRWEMHLPDGSSVKGLKDWQEIDEIRIFSGEISYTAKVKLSKEADKAVLELGEVRELARVIVNGKKVETLIAPPFDCDITKYFKKGENTIEVRVTNCLVSKYENKPYRSGMFGKTKLRIF